MKAWCWESESDSMKTDYKQNNNDRVINASLVFLFVMDGCPSPYLGTVPSACPKMKWILLTSTWNNFKYGRHLVNCCAILFFFASQYAFKWLCGLLVFYSVRYCRIVFPLNQFNARLLKLGLICADVWCHVFALCHPHAVSFLIQIKHHFTHLHRRSIISASATASACCVTLTFFFFLWEAEGII